MSDDDARLARNTSADAEPENFGRALLGTGGLLLVLLAGAVLMRVGTHLLPFAWDPLSPWPTAGDVVPAHVVRSELAVYEDPLLRKSGRHRFQLFVTVAPDAGASPPVVLAGPAQDADDLVAGQSQIAWFVSEAALVVGPIVPALRVSPGLHRAITGEEQSDGADAASVERARIASSVAWFDEWPAFRAYGTTAPLALRIDGERVAVEAQWQSERERRALPATRAAAFALVAVAMLTVFGVARVLLPMRPGRRRTLLALVIAASYPWWAAQLPRFARWLAPPGPTSALGVGVRSITEASWLTRDGPMPLRRADAAERGLLDSLVPLSPTQLRGYTPLTAWLASVAVEPQVLTGAPWEALRAAQVALFDAAVATLPDIDAATLAALDAELAQRNDAANPDNPIAALRAAVTAEQSRRGSP